MSKKDHGQMRDPVSFSVARLSWLRYILHRRDKRVKHRMFCSVQRHKHGFSLFFFFFFFGRNRCIDRTFSCLRMVEKQFHVPEYLEASSLDCNLTLTVSGIKSIHRCQSDQAEGKKISTFVGSRFVFDSS